MGDRLRVEVALEGLDAVPEALMMVTFTSSLDESLFRVTSQMQPLVAAHPRRPLETIVLDLPSLPLTPGDYSIELPLKGPQGTVDFVRRAADFTVVPANVLGTGYHFSASDGHYMVPFEWELRPTPADT
jgi:hypothetical protein